MEPSRKLCLNMIVKNEKKVIERCLNSIKGVIDYWVIVDTGSTDGTQDLIRKTLKDIPGELHERPWVNFGHNRQEALTLAKGKADYVLLIDADEVMEFPKKFKASDLDKDYYLVRFLDTDDKLMADKGAIINNRLNWDWKGAIHEQLSCPQAMTFELLTEVKAAYNTSQSQRSQDPKKYERDAEILEKELEKEPNNSRYVFYLAQSYANGKQYEKALQNYDRRTRMEGCQHELFWALLSVGKLKEYLKHPPEAIIAAYSKACEQFSSRAEPCFYLGDYFLKNNNFILAYLLAEQGRTLPPPPTGGYTEHLVYDCLIELLFANAAFALNRFAEALPIYQKHAGRTDLAPQGLEFIAQRLAICANQLRSQQAGLFTGAMP